jgi:hypothetical protein
MMGGGGMDGIFFAAFAQRDIKGAFERLGDLDNKTKGIALTTMASQVTMDPAKRQEFISELDRLGDAKLRQSAMEGMIGTWAFQDPQGAAEFISTHEWEDGREKEMRDRLADSWANMDAEASLKWRLENLQQGEDRAAAVASGFTRWIRQDPQQAQEWLETQPEEVRTDSLYTQTADQFRWSSNYADAAQWAGRIEDQPGREAKLRDIYTAWQGEDSEAAQQWLGGLDEPTRAAVQVPAEEMDAPKATESR